jgi:long-subunit fatty acid transport protein
MKLCARLSAAAVVTAALVLPASVALPAGAAHASPAALACHASMSNSHPADYTTTDVKVRTVAHAYVTTVAHYKTVNRKYHHRANVNGRATVPYYISGATPGRKVVVDVYVSRPGRKGHCSTSFTPHN